MGAGALSSGICLRTAIPLTSDFPLLMGGKDFCASSLTVPQGPPLQTRAFSDCFPAPWGTSANILLSGEDRGPEHRVEHVSKAPVLLPRPGERVTRGPRPGMEGRARTLSSLAGVR